MPVEVVGAEETYPLRRMVLRDGEPDAPVSFPEDGRHGGFHLGVRDGDEIVAVASFSPEGTPARPGRRAARLRGMAVHPDFQRRGFGRRLLDVAAERLRTEGYEVLWGNGRDSALGFYRRLGWEVVGKRFLAGPAGDIPHHVVVVDLTGRFHRAGSAP